MKLVETVDAYLYLARLTMDLAEAEDPSIGTIAAKAALGDGSALAELYSRYAGSLTKIASAYVDAETAQDVVQDLFIKFHEKKFASYAPSFNEDGRSAWAVLATAVKRAALNSRKLAQRATTGVDDMAGAAGADKSTVKRTGHVEPLSKNEKDTVRNVVQRAISQAKFTDQERKYIETLFGRPGEELKDITRFFSDAADADRDEKSLQDIARSIWPDKNPNAAGVAGNRTREKFLKQFCQDKELLALLPGGHQTLRGNKQLKPVCAKFEDVDPVVVFAVQAGLVEDVESPARDKAYIEVLRWVARRV